MKSFIFIVSLLISTDSIAANVKIGEENLQFPVIGAHHPLLLITKSSSPQNQIVGYTQLDDNCDIITDGFRNGNPMLNFYWLMGGTTYKPVNSILENRLFRPKFSLAKDPQSLKAFMINVPALAGFRNDLPSKSLKIVTEKKAGRCVARTMLQLGPTHQNQILNVQSIMIQTGWGYSIQGVLLIGLNALGQALIVGYGTYLN